LKNVKSSEICTMWRGDLVSEVKALQAWFARVMKIIHNTNNLVVELIPSTKLLRLKRPTFFCHSSTSLICLHFSTTWLEKDE
jgi:hypothetical protein